DCTPTHPIVITSAQRAAAPPAVGRQTRKFSCDRPTVTRRSNQVDDRPTARRRRLHVHPRTDAPGGGPSPRERGPMQPLQAQQAGTVFPCSTPIRFRFQICLPCGGSCALTRRLAAVCSCSEQPNASTLGRPSCTAAAATASAR